MTAGAGAIAVCILLASRLEAQQPPVVVPPRVQEERLIYRVPPEYPERAKQARIEGTVRLAALIDEDGKPDRLKLISGHPLLVKAAFDAVKQWRYRPTERSGARVPVVTSIVVSFSMRARPPSALMRVSGIKPAEPGDENCARERS